MKLGVACAEIAAGKLVFVIVIVAVIFATWTRQGKRIGNAKEKQRKRT